MKRIILSYFGYLYLFAKAATRYSGMCDDVSIMSERCRNRARYLLNETNKFNTSQLIILAVGCIF